MHSAAAACCAAAGFSYLACPEVRSAPARQQHPPGREGSLPWPSLLEHLQLSSHSCSTHQD